MPLGLILAMSSTAIVIQSLNERGQLKTSAGQSSFSVLLFQDIAVIPMLALLPLLAVQQSTSYESSSLIAEFPAWAQTLSVLAAVAAIVLAGRYLMRPLFRFVAQSGIREIFVAFALLIVVGITLMMQFVGLSAALGTFLAGVVLAESEYRHELEMDLNPFKGLLLAVFFMAVGAGIDFNLLMANPMQILGLVLGFLILKLVVLYVIARHLPHERPRQRPFCLLAGARRRIRLRLDFILPRPWDFCLPARPQCSWQLLQFPWPLAPLLMITNENFIQPLFARGGQIRDADVIDESARVIIAGHGRFGMTVGRMLQGKGYKTVVLDHDAEQIDALRRFGFKLFYGDASRVDLLEAAGARTAEVW